MNPPTWRPGSASFKFAHAPNRHSKSQKSVGTLPTQIRPRSGRAPGPPSPPIYIRLLHEPCFRWCPGTRSKARFLPQVASAAPSVGGSTAARPAQKKSGSSQRRKTPEKGKKTRPTQSAQKKRPTSSERRSCVGTSNQEARR